MIHVTTRTLSLDVSKPRGSLEFNVRACSAAGEGEASSVIYKRGGGDGYRVFLEHLASSGYKDMSK